MSLPFERFMDAKEFVRALSPLRAFRGEYMGTRLLEEMEAARLLFPRLRLRFPDDVGRRFWVEAHDHMPRQMRHPVEPDGPRWEAAVELHNALHRRANIFPYGLVPHPFDAPEPRYSEFLQRPAERPFERWQDIRTDISNEVEETLFDDINFENYYTTWQVLLAAEVADAGISMRLNLAEEGVYRAAMEAIQNGRAPANAPSSFKLSPVHVARDFAKHENALDAVVWFEEERRRALNHILKARGGGRFRLSPEESASYDLAGREAASASVKRFEVSTEDLIALIQFLAGRWSDWNREGRPFIADAYKDFLGGAVILARRVSDLSFVELASRVGQVGGRFKPILDVIWPNWAEEEKDRVRITLKASMTPDKADPVADADIDAFVNFIAAEGLEAFFWRLKSFEEHALRGNEYALEGMKSDVQGMAVAVEHIAAALGATELQLYEKFKQLWREPSVLKLLKRGDVSPLARQERLANDWPVLKAKIDAVRNETGGKIAADLVMAHRIRGGVHSMLPEDDEFALEALFVGLMRAAVLTFREVRRNAVPLKQDS